MADALSAALAQGDTNWNAYFLSQAEALEDSWKRAIAAYRQMRTVSDILGIPYLSQPDPAKTIQKGLPTAWTPDMEQGLVDLGAMKDIAVAALRDVAAGKRQVAFNKEGDWIIPSIPTDPVLVALDANGIPVLCKAGSDPCEPAHGSGSLGIVWIEIAVVVGAALIAGGTLWVMKSGIDKVPDVAARIAEVKVNETWSECQQAALKAGSDPKLCTAAASAVGAARIQTIDAEAAKITAQQCAANGGSYSPATKICTPGDTPTEKLVRTLLWGAAGLGVIYTVVKLGPGLLEETKARRSARTLRA